MHHCVNSKEEQVQVCDECVPWTLFQLEKILYIIIYNCNLTTLHCNVSALNLGTELSVLLLPLLGACCKMI